MRSTLYKHSGNHMPGSHPGTLRTTGLSGLPATRRCQWEPAGNAGQSIRRRRQSGDRLHQADDAPLILMKTGQSSVSVALGLRRDQSRAHSSFPNELPGVTRHRAAPHRSAR